MDGGTVDLYISGDIDVAVIEHDAQKHGNQHIEKRGEDLLDQGRELVIEHIYFGVGIHIQDGAGGQVDGVDHQIAGQFLGPGKGVVEDVAQDDLHKGQPNGENQEGNANAQ